MPCAQLTALHKAFSVENEEVATRRQHRASFRALGRSNAPRSRLARKPLNHVGKVAVLGLDIDVQVGFKALTDHPLKWGEVDRLVVVEVDTLVLITIVSKGIVCNLILATCGQSHTREPLV